MVLDTEGNTWHCCYHRDFSPKFPLNVFDSQTNILICRNKEHALSPVPLDTSRWTPKGETNGLSTLYVQKAYQLDVGDIVSVFLGGE